MKAALLSRLRTASRGILAASIVSLVLAVPGRGAAVPWSGVVPVDSTQANGDDISLIGSATVTISGTGGPVTENTLTIQTSGTASLALNNATSGPQQTLSVLGYTQFSNDGTTLQVSGSANFDPGPIAEAGTFSNIQIVKNGGSGLLILDNVNSYIPNLILQVLSGTMSVVGGGGTVSPISSVGAPLQINGNGGTLLLGTAAGAGSGTTFANSLNVNASGTLQHTATSADTLQGGLSVASGQTLSADIEAGSLTVTGTVSGNFGKLGDGLLKIIGTYQSPGPTAIGGGTLQFGTTASLYADTTSSWTAANLPVSSGATVAFNVGGANEFATGDINTLLTNLGGLGGAVSNNGLKAGSFVGFDTTNALGGNFAIANNIADSTGTGGGAVGVTKLGTNTLTLSGANTYTGVTTVAAGTLSAASIASGGPGSLGSASSAVVLGASATKGTLSYTGNSASFPRGFTVNAGGGEIDTTTGGQLLTIGTGGIALGSGVTNSSLTIGGAGDTTINCAVSLGTASGSLTMSGSGTLNLNGAQGYKTLNTNAGTTNVNAALASGASVNANATTNFTASQTLASLNIGSAVLASAADENAAAAPEPGAAALLIFSALGALSLRRR